MRPLFLLLAVTVFSLLPVAAQTAQGMDGRLPKPIGPIIDPPPPPGVQGDEVEYEWVKVPLRFIDVAAFVAQPAAAP